MNILLNLTSLIKFLKYSILLKYFKNLTNVVLWLAQVDSNHRPRAYQARALTTWAMSHHIIGSDP